MFYGGINTVSWEKQSSEMRKDITSIIRFSLGEIVRVYGCRICLMGADSVSWEQNMFHGDGFCLMRVKVQNISAMAPKCHENQRSVVACSNYVQRQW